MIVGGFGCPCRSGFGSGGLGPWCSDYQTGFSMPHHGDRQFPSGGRYAKLAAEFGTNPPPDGIPMVRAQRELGLKNDTMLALIRSGQVRAGVGKYCHGARPSWALLVSKTECMSAAP